MNFYLIRTTAKDAWAIQNGIHVICAKSKHSATKLLYTVCKEDVVSCDLLKLTKKEKILFTLNSLIE